MAIFYCNEIEENEFTLPEDESRHCVKVLRHKNGDIITVINGKGLTKEVRIIADKASKVVCQTVSATNTARNKAHRVHVAIAPTKNMDRIEWFVEKACELDIDEISFVFSEHSERKVLKTERLHKKAISALKQSGGFYRTRINEPVKLKEFIAQDHSNIKLIAHVDQHNPVTLKTACEARQDYLVLIGPEGDFSQSEVTQCKNNGYQPISLGTKVLRTETAGIIACHSLNFINDY